MATELTGTIAVSPVITGDIVHTVLTGSISITPVITGNIASQLYTTGSISISPRIGGTIFAVAGYTSDANYITLPALTCSATGMDSPMGVGSLKLPMLSLTYSGIMSVIGNLSKTLPKFTISAQGSRSIIGVSQITIPHLILQADGLPSIIGNLSAELPSLALTAEMLRGATGSLDTSIPKMSLFAAGILSAVGVASISIPRLFSTGTVLRGATGSLDQDIPPLTLSATGILSCSGTGAVTLPALTLTSTFILQSYLNMVMNIRNAALTLYDNYDFNSMCRFNGKHFGATKTAIYNLDLGTTDAGTLIDWNFRTGYLDLEQKSKKKLRQTWLSVKTNGNLILTVAQPNGDEYEYSVEGVDITEEGIRVKCGKGIRSKYVAIDLKNVDGSTITLDVLKLHLEKLGGTR
jgi:hypothetical protein